MLKRLFRILKRTVTVKISNLKMWKAILLPSKANLILWAYAIFLLLLLAFNLADPLTVVFAYFLETIIIGIIHLIKLWLVIKHGRKSPDPEGQKNGIPLLIFFVFHYGMFVAIQSVFAFTLFSSSIADIRDGFNLIQNYSYVLDSNGMPVILASIIISNLSYFFNNFWRNEKYRDYSPDKILLKPYVRIFIQQFVVLLAFFFFIIFNSGIVAAILLILFRLLVDLIIVSIKKDSRFLELLSTKLGKTPEEWRTVKEQLEEFSE